MTDGEHKKNQPTEKMLSFAQSIAERKGILLPSAAKDSYEACKAFLDEHGQLLPPSKKALDWAQEIARKKNLPLSAETCADARRLSEWIETNK